MELTRTPFSCSPIPESSSAEEPGHNAPWLGFQATSAGGRPLPVSYWNRRRKTVRLRLPSAEHGLLMLWKLLYFHSKREAEMEKKQNMGGICIAHGSPLTRATIYFMTGRYCPETRLVFKFNRHSTGGKTGNKRKSKKWQGRDLFWDFSISKTTTASLTVLTFAIQQWEKRCTYPACIRVCLLYCTLPEQLYVIQAVFSRVLIP